MSFEQSEKTGLGKATVEEKQGPIYDPIHNQFNQVVEYRGVWYEAREQNGDRCLYRLGSGDYFNSPNPAYITIDKNGNVLEARDVTSKPWLPKNAE